MDATRRLGPWLVFFIVYADIGTSIYYVPALLYGSIRELATLAQLLTLLVFVSICRKYVEICDRCPDGGGVVSIADKAFPGLPSLALVGGAMITIDYFLTSAISGVTGIYYLETIAPFSKDLVVPITLVCLAGLIALNIIGLKESATVAAFLAVAKIAVTVLIMVCASIVITSRGAWNDLFDHIFRPDVKLTVTSFLIGYADTWLAYSGLESGAQVAGAMAPPARRTASLAMWGVIISIAILSPSMTAFSIYLVDDETKVADPEAFISHLALAVTEGQWLQILTVISATLLLIMACNTALVGNYHVNSRLTAAGFLPSVLATRNRRFGTPHISIVISGVVPMLVLLATRGKVHALGDLYAFGLLGTLVISSISVDVLRWREHGNPFKFLIGSFTTLALLLAWLINLVHKPHALLFGGGLTALFVGIGFAFRAGWIRVGAARPTFASWREVEALGGASPTAAKVLTLSEAKDLRPLESARTLVALRALNPRLLEDAAWLAKGQGERGVYVIFVDEAPGLFLPQPGEVAPSEEALGVLTHAFDILRDRYGLLALPIWRLSNDTSTAIAEAARELSCTSVLVGTTKRSAVWRLLRGNVLNGLLRALPSETRLLISS